LRQSGTGAIAERYDVSDPTSNLTWVGSALTIDPTSDLESSTGYYLEIDSTAIVDQSGNAFVGISDAATWNFTTAATMLPFVERFEACAFGALNGQRGWVASGAVVQGDVTHGGARAASLTNANGYLRHTFDDAHSQVWTDMQIRISQSDGPLAIDPEDTCALFVLTNNAVMVSDGASVVDSGLRAEEGVWTRITLFTDYTAKTWELYVDDRHAGPFGFLNTAASAYHELRLTGKAVGVDDVAVTANSLLSTLYAAGGTITPRAWVLSYGGQPDNSDEDGDGLSLDQEFLLETNPTQSNRFEIIDVGVTPDNRPYLLYHANGLPNGHLTVSNTFDLGSGEWSRRSGQLSQPSSNMVQWTGDEPVGTNECIRIHVR
jgi:hypothetical protein